MTTVIGWAIGLISAAWLAAYGDALRFIAFDVRVGEATTAIGRRTASLFREWLQAQLVTDQKKG